MPEGQTVQENQDAIAQVFEAAGAFKDNAAKDDSDAKPVTTRVVDFATTGDDAFISEDGRTTYALYQGPIPTTFDPAAGYLDEIRPLVESGAKDAGFTGGVTSYGTAVRR